MDHIVWEIKKRLISSFATAIWMLNPAQAIKGIRKQGMPVQDSIQIMAVVSYA